MAAKLAQIGVSGGSVCLDLNAGASGMRLHWPLSNMAEAAQLLGEVSCCKADASTGTPRVHILMGAPPAGWVSV